MGQARKGRTSPRLEVSLQWKTVLGDYGTAIAWSSDGCWLGAASATGEVILYRMGSALGEDSERSPSQPATIVLRSGDGTAISALAFSADSQYLAAAGQAGTLWVWSLSQPDHPPLKRHHPGVWIDALAWHPLESYLVYGVADCAVVLKLESEYSVFDTTQSGEFQLEEFQLEEFQAEKLVVAELSFQASSVLHLAWQPQGAWLAIAGHGGVKVWDTTDWAQPPRLLAVPGASLHSTWSPDGVYLASGNLDRTLTVAEWESPPPWLMQGFPGKVRQLAWLPPLKSTTPRLAAACVDCITLWERQGQRWTSTVLQHHQSTVEAIALQPAESGETQLLASASQDGQVGLWYQGRQWLQALKGFDQGVSGIAWSPCGRQLAAVGRAGELRLWSVLLRTAKGFGVQQGN